MSEGGVYFSAPSRTSRVLPVVLILVVIAFGGLLWLWPSSGGDGGPDQPEAPAAAPEAAAAEDDLSAPVPVTLEEEETPAEPAASLTTAAGPMVFVQSLACRAVETNSTWTAFAWHTRLGTSSPNPPTVSLTIAVLDKDGFILDTQRVYRAKVGPATAGAYQDRMLVRNAQAEQVRVCQAQIQVDEEILDTAQAQVSIDIQRQTQGEPAPSIASAPRPSGKVQVWGRPRINRIEDSAIVVVEFWNPGPGPATAHFDVELSVDGAFVDSTSDSVEVGPGQRVTRQFSFDARSQGAASVNVQFR